MKVVLRVLAVLALLVVIAAGAVVFTLTRGGTNLDNWLAQQVVTIANYYLVPEIAFQRFRYDAPGTLTLEDATLTAPDGTRVVEASSIVVTLAKTPSIGKPLEISSVTLASPQVNLIQDKAGGFKGLVPFVRSQRVKEQDRAPSDVRLSNVLRIRNLTMTDGGLLFQPASDEPPMELSGLALDLDIEPANQAGEQGAWYAVVAQADRAPIFDFTLEGRFDIDNLVADIASLSFDTTLDEQSVGALPPRLQTLVRQYDAGGDLAIDAHGVVPIRDFANADLTATVRLEDFHVAQGEYRFPLTLAALDATLKDGKGVITQGFADTLGGRVSLANASVDMRNEFKPFDASWKIEGVDLQQLLRSKPADQPPKIAGILHGEGRVTGSSLAPKETIDGWGTLALRKGRLVKIPVITDVLSTLKVLDKLTGRSDLSDQADVAFDLDPEGVMIEELTIVTQVAAVRGAEKPAGVIRYDGTMDLRVNAGPLEKLQSMLGKVGDIFGAITNQLASYRVYGPVSDPKVSVRVLGVGGR